MNTMIKFTEWVKNTFSKGDIAKKEDFIETTVSFNSTPPEVTFPSKSGQDAAMCISLLDLYGSLFCLDNQNILFEDIEGNKKVIKPLKKLPPTERADLDAYEVDEGFAIHYKEHDYYYQATMNVVRIYNNIRIKLEDVHQPIYGISIGADGLIIINKSEDPAKGEPT